MTDCQSANPSGVIRSLHGARKATKKRTTKITNSHESSEVNRFTLDCLEIELELQEIPS
jgi:hypothetical protein